MDVASAWIALPLMGPQGGKLLFTHPTFRQRAAPKRPSSPSPLFPRGDPLSFMLSSLTHPLRPSGGRRAGSCLIGVSIPVAWPRDSHVDKAWASLINDVSGLFSIPIVFSSPCIKHGQIIIHKYLQ